MRLLLLPLLLAIAGCSLEKTGLTVDDSVAARAPYPGILPYEDLETPDTSRLTEDSEAALTARARRLQRRAQALGE